MLETVNETLDTARPYLAQLTWRTLLSPALSGPENMGCDATLMERARATGEAVLRIYSWSAPTLSFGRNQRTDGYDRDGLARAGIEVVRRPTGGRAILHHREITYSVTAPAEPGESITTEYEWINSLLLRALRAMGVDAVIAPRTGRAPAPDANPCFATATPGEITAGGRKLVGSAQYRDDGALLQHGSILVADDQATLATLAATEPAAPPATLEQLLGRAPQPRELHDALRSALAEDGLDAAGLAHDDVAESTARHAPAFRNPDWTWRR
ncbi:MAG: biotin/lipoate A/B protein ligase family protein [Gemmatimonadaceae bacterium]